jgi:hypothetical protein
MNKRLTGWILLGFAFFGFVIFILGSVGFVNLIREKSPSAFEFARAVVWTLDKEIPNVGATLEAPLMELKLSRNDVLHFDDLYSKYENPKYGNKYYSQHNVWRKAEIRFEGKKYKIKIKSQGRSPTSHRKGRFISYTIKVTNKRNIRGVTRFNLIIRERIQPQRHINKLLARKFGLIYQETKPIRLKINGWDEKLYFWEDRLSSDLMEVKYNTSLAFFRAEPSNGVVSDKSLLVGRKGKVSFDRKTQQKKFDSVFDDFGVDEAKREHIFDRYYSINSSIVSGNPEGFDQYFDLDYISSYESVRFLMGFIGHGSLEGNLYAAINYSNGKFYPTIVRDNVQRIYRLEDSETIESKLESYVNDAIPFLRMLSRNDVIRQAKYKKAYNFVTDAKVFLREQEDLYEKYERLFYRGWILQLLRKISGTPFPGVFRSNSQVIVSYLERSNPIYSFQIDKGQWFLKVDANSMAALQLKELQFEHDTGLNNTEQLEVAIYQLVDGVPKQLALTSAILSIGPKVGMLKFDNDVLSFFDRLDENLQRRSHPYYIGIVKPKSELPAINTKSLSFINIVSGKEHKGRLVADLPAATIELLAGATRNKIESKVEEFASSNPNLGLNLMDNKNLHLGPGKYNIDEDTVFPNGVNLVIKAGTEITIHPGRSLIVRGGLKIDGTTSQPVIIHSTSDVIPFGVFGVIGDGTTEVEINHLDLSYGHEAWHQGIYLSGSLSIYHHDNVVITDSSISNGAADDGLNIKFARNVELDGNMFFDNTADQVDLDYVAGIVRHSKFSKSSTGDRNGDGLDASGSNLTVFENSFTGFEDKGVSVGEDSRVILKRNHFSDNALGVAVKDNSVVFANHNQFENNRLDYRAYQKKKIFGGGKLVIPKLATTGISIETDRYSSVENLSSEQLEAIEEKMAQLKNRGRSLVGHSLGN